MATRLFDDPAAEPPPPRRDADPPGVSSGWERDFLLSVLNAERLSPRQSEKLLLIAGKAAMPVPKRRSPRRHRGRPRR